ncbi:MAG: SDR family oxidoreductase [Candidatus Latescibacteria bacterium]|nr:SDR family oxidoreductase [Candidatus Latescibacterota bacterium]
MARYLVTGGAGFIGSHLCRRLVAEGHAVRVLDNLSTGKRANLEGVEVDWAVGDLRDEALLAAALRGVEYVYHHAAIASVAVSVAQPLLEQEVNVVGTLRLLEAARQAGVRRLVFAASAAAYGNNPESPKREGMRPEPASPYGLSKVAGEYYCRIYSEIFGLETVCLRYFNVFGPRQDPASPYSGVISLFVKRLLLGQPPIIQGDGEQSRDFVYVEDVVQANLRASQVDQARGEVYNIGCGCSTTIKELAGLLNQLLGTGLEPEFAPARPGDVRRSLADISRACAGLGYAPAFTLTEGLARTLEWMRAANLSN